MSIREWVHNREIDGRPSFSFEEVTNAFPSLTSQHIRNDLYRLRRSEVIAQPFKGFYVVIPPHYSAKGIVPPVYYIDQLMDYLSRPYYICLLSAAELLGAAHQRPQEFSVMTVLPRIRMSRLSSLDWNYRSSIPEGFLKEINSETGTIKFSGPELTALDLVQYEQHVGGLSRAATVIEELSEQTVWIGAAERGLLVPSTIATVQRLGYIMENVLTNQSQADDLYHELKIVSPKLNRFRLSTRKDVDGAILNKRWNIIVNTEIEIDDL